MIATIAEIKVQRSLRSHGHHSSAVVAIVATTIAEIDLSCISTTVAIVAFFVAIATIVATIVAIAAIIWKPALTCLSAMNAQVKCAQTFTAIVLPLIHVISHALWTFLSTKTITINLY